MSGISKRVALSGARSNSVTAPNKGGDPSEFLNGIDRLKSLAKPGQRFRMAIAVGPYVSAPPPPPKPNKTLPKEYMAAISPKPLDIQATSESGAEQYGYGGSEVIAYLEQKLLSEAGIDVHLYASGDSKTSGTLHPIVEQSLWTVPASGVRLLDDASALYKDIPKERYDSVVFHAGPAAFKLSAQLQDTPHVHMLHGPIYPETKHQYPKDVPLLSISNAQRAPMPDLNYVGTVYHGVVDNKPANYTIPETATGREGVLYIGRMSPKKGVKEAIEAAKLAKVPIDLVGPVQEWDKEYFEKDILPLIDGKTVRWFGEISKAEQFAFMRNKIAVIAPSNVEESFGMVGPEANSLGVPLVASTRGAFQEIICQGKTGYTCDGVPALATAIHDSRNLSPHAIRQFYLANFTPEIMIDRLANVLADQIEAKRSAA